MSGHNGGGRQRGKGGQGQTVRGPEDHPQGLTILRMKGSLETESRERRFSKHHPDSREVAGRPERKQGEGAI